MEESFRTNYSENFIYSLKLSRSYVKTRVVKFVQSISKDWSDELSTVKLVEYLSQTLP